MSKKWSGIAMIVLWILFIVIIVSMIRKKSIVDESPTIEGDYQSVDW